jgi:putative OPT family oligopeptide transporter
LPIGIEENKSRFGRDQPFEPELTGRAIVLGVALAVTLGAANAYLGLFAGLTVSASIPAAVISMAVLRALGGTTILENNVVQTIASAGEAVAAGAVFTLPALVIVGKRSVISYPAATVLCLCGGTFGSLLIVFLRRTYIEHERLPYPEGFACAEVLRAGAGGVQAKSLVVGGILSASLKIGQQIFGLVPDSLTVGRWTGGVPIVGAFDISAALIGVGFILGIRIAAVIFSGGVIAWFIAIPAIFHSAGAWRDAEAAAAANAIWNAHVRYIGVGSMMVGGMATLWRLRTRVVGGINAGLHRVTSGARGQRLESTQLDLAPSLVTGALLFSVIAAGVIFWELSNRFWLSVTLAVALLVVGSIGSAIAGYLTGLVGASNNPVSGVTVIIVLTIAGLLMALGVSPAVGPTLTILTAVMVCTGAAMAGDSLHDLATGYHLGATPRALEVGVLIGAGASACTIVPVLHLLITAYGIAGSSNAPAGALAAPQAFLIANVARGMFLGGLPWRAIEAGAIIAVAFEMLDRLLEKKGSSWRTPSMPMAIGLYLPLGLSVTIVIGALLSRVAGRHVRDNRSVTLFAAGLVAGEALIGVVGGAMVVSGLRLPIY